MKELTTEITLKLTSIDPGTEAEIEEFIRKDRAEDAFKGLIDHLKVDHDFDNVTIADIKHFVNDVKEESEQPAVNSEIDYDKLADKVLEKLIARGSVNTEVFVDSEGIMRG